MDGLTSRTSKCVTSRVDRTTIGLVFLSTSFLALFLNVCPSTVSFIVFLRSPPCLLCQVPILADPAQTVRDFWRVVASAAAAAAATTSAAVQPGKGSGHLNAKVSKDDVVAAASAAAAAAAVSSGPEGDNDEDEGAGGRAEGSANNDEFVLPHGQVLMRQQTRAGMAASARSTQSLLLSGDGAEGFLYFPDDVLGGSGCRLEDGEELILVRCRKRCGVVLGALACKLAFFRCVAVSSFIYAGFHIVWLV